MSPGHKNLTLENSRWEIQTPSLSRTKCPIGNTYVYGSIEEPEMIEINRIHVHDQTLLQPAHVHSPYTAALIPLS